MRKKVTLITGVSGEVGLALVKSLAELGYNNLLTLDLRSLPPEYNQYSIHIQGDILDKSLLNRLVSEYEIVAIFHLAALLSTRAEFTPVAAHHVNVEGTMGLLQLAAEQSEWRGEPVLFIFPSSIAAYGMPDLKTKSQYPRVREWEWNYPITMYGCNKLYCEMLGTYFCSNYRQLATEAPQMLDFRSVRFPGLISALTVPSGGTSDYGPEMLHAAAQSLPYSAFVRPDTQIPFMAMPDAVNALLLLSRAERESLNRTVYNVTSYSLTAEQFREQVLMAFPAAEIDFKPDLKRQKIVDSWPADLNDNDSRRDWGWKPEYNMERSFNEYLVPNIRKRYQV
ncbi:MAG: NAD-dependent epimerase/dehydratase family protein [Chloroflexota bacterium]|nr:MAG: NAD-dependent epimerase/dehydratase family protein [Chloroflexota bacterium]